MYNICDNDGDNTEDKTVVVRTILNINLKQIKGKQQKHVSVYVDTVYEWTCTFKVAGEQCVAGEQAANGQGALKGMEKQTLNS